MKHTEGHRQELPARAAAELEALLRLAAVRDICDAFLAGHWEIDSGLVLLATALLDQAGAWAMIAEEADGRRSAA